MKKQVVAYIEERDRGLCQLIAVATFVDSYYIFSRLSIGNDMDDAIFRVGVDAFGSWKRWAETMYQMHSGRILIHTLVWIFLNIPLFIWRGISSALVIISAILCERITSCTIQWRRAPLLLFFVVLFFLIPRQDKIVFEGVSFSLNYLYPVSAMLLVLYFFYLTVSGKHLSTALKIMGIPAVLLCSNMEQSGAVVLAMGIVFLGYGCIFNCLPEKRESIYAIALWVLNLVGVLINYLAPGNQIRYSNEMMKASGYGMISVTEKLMLGIQAIFVNFFHFRGFVIWLMPTFLLFLIGIAKKNKKNRLLAIVNAALAFGQYLFIKYVMDVNFLHPYNTLYNIWVLLSCLLLLMNNIVIIKAMKSIKEQFLYTCMYVAALVSSIVMCFSPTMYVCASRTVYISYILLILICVAILNNLLLCLYSDTDPFSKEDVERNKIKIRVISAYALSWLIFSLCLLTLYIHGYKKVDVYNKLEFAKSNRFLLENVTIAQNGKLTAELDVSDFEYTPVLWTTGRIELEDSIMEKVALSGYDINVQIGVMDESEDTIIGYKTCLLSEYPTMIRYPNERIQINAYLDLLKKQGKTLVLLAKIHDGEQYYQIIDYDF